MNTQVVSGIEKAAVLTLNGHFQGKSDDQGNTGRWLCIEDRYISDRFIRK